MEYYFNFHLKFINIKGNLYLGFRECNDNQPAYHKLRETTFHHWKWYTEIQHQVNVSFVLINMFHLSSSEYLNSLNVFF